MSLMSQLQDQLAATRREKDQRGEKNVLRRLAELYAIEGQWDRWLACEEHALPLARAIGTPQEIVEILCNVGAAYTDANWPDRAITHLEEALGLARKNSLLRHEAATLGNLARALSLTDSQKSLKTYDEALQAAHQSGPRDELLLLPGAMWAAQHAQQPERAILYAKQGVKSARLAQERALEGHFLLELGLLLEKSAPDDAARCLRAARPLLHVTASNADLSRCDEALTRLPGMPKPAATEPLLPKIPDETLAGPKQRLAKNPRDILALVGRAEASLNNNQPAQALEDIEQALQIVAEEPRLQGKMRESVQKRLEELHAHAQASLGK